MAYWNSLSHSPQRWKSMSIGPAAGFEPGEFRLSLSRRAEPLSQAPAEISQARGNSYLFELRYNFHRQ